MSLGCAGALTACGGGGGSSGTEAPVSQATSSIAPAPTNVVVAVYGDSTVFGSTLLNGTYIQAPHNAPAVLQYLLQQQFGAAVTVENHGVPGSTAVNLLWGQAPVAQAWTAEMAQSKASIVIINPAINDAFEPNETDQDFTYTYGQLVQIARAAGKTVIIETPNPINNDHESILSNLVQDERAVARDWSLQVIDQFDYLPSLSNWAVLLCSDGIHPTDDGYEVKAEQEMAVIGPVVQSLLTSP